MKKDTIAILVLITCFIAGIFFWKYGYPFFGGCCCGCTAMLLLFSTLGKWQHKKAADIIDKIINDKRAAAAGVDILND